MSTTTLLVVTTLLSLLVFATLKLLPRINRVFFPWKRRSLPSPRRLGSPTHLLIVLGSGGHTAEMLAMLRDLDPTHITFRTYVVSSGDDFSAKKAAEFEQSLASRFGPGGASRQNDGQVFYVGKVHFAIHTVPRARRIYQPLYTTPRTCAQCFVGCVRALRAVQLPGHDEQDGNVRRPDLIVTNGPATAVVVVFAALMLKLLGLVGPDEMRTVYVESFARVKKLSLSGRILFHVVDRFFVQWEVLKKRIGGRAEFIGVLV